MGHWQPQKYTVGGFSAGFDIVKCPNSLQQHPGSLVDTGVKTANQRDVRRALPFPNLLLFVTWLIRCQNRLSSAID